MYIPIGEIKRELPPEQYGLKKWLFGDLYVTPDDEICIKKPAGSLTNGYDCFDAALKVREILQKYGIKSNVFSGVDEKGMWQTHYFVKTDNGIIVDGVDLYKTIGANHKHRKMTSEKEIGNLQSFITFKDGLIPLRYQILNEKTKILSKIGIRRFSDLDAFFIREYGWGEPLTDIILDTTLIEYEIPVQALEITASFNEFSLRNRLYNLGALPLNMSMDERIKEFGWLLDNETVQLSSSAYDLKLHHSGFLEPIQISSVDKVNPILKEEIEKDMDVLIYLVEKIPNAHYA